MTKLSSKYWVFPVAIALGTLATPASADVWVTAEVTKQKDVYVTETITKYKSVYIEVYFDEDLTGAAEAMAVVNVTNAANSVDDARVDSDPLDPFGLQLHAIINDSIKNNKGVVQFNQDVGNMANQGNILALASVGTPDEGALGAFTDSQAAVDQLNLNNYVRWVEDIGDDPDNPDYSNTPHKSAVIRGSILNNSGVIGVNQNAGNMNNQTNAVALAIGFDAKFALSEAMLGQENTGNVIDEIETVRVDRIVDSVSGNSGVVSVNQSSGNMNNQGSVVAFSALTASANINVPSP